MVAKRAEPTSMIAIQGGARGRIDTYTPDPAYHKSVPLQCLPGVTDKPPPIQNFKQFMVRLVRVCKWVLTHQVEIQFVSRPRHSYR